MQGLAVLPIGHVTTPDWPSDHGGDAALSAAQARGDVRALADRLAALAPAWYRDSRHALLCAWCDALAPRLPGPLPEPLPLWRALATWYVAPADALAQLRALGVARGLGAPGHRPAPPPRLGDDLFLLAAWWRSELAVLAPAARLRALGQAIDDHLAAPGADALATVHRLGGETAGVTGAALLGAPPGDQAARARHALAQVARLDDRHSLCSTVALGRWPLLRGCFDLARETCELITVGLLAGDDAHMPLAHGWLMALQAALATPGRWDLLAAWRDGSIDHAAVLASPIAPTLLGALAALEAQAPPALDAGVQTLVLARQDGWSAHERWHALAARAWHHLRGADLPAARAVLRLLQALPVGPDTLLGVTAQLLHAQAQALAGDGPHPDRLVAWATDADARGWPGPALLARGMAWAAAARAGTAPDALPAALHPARGAEAWVAHGLALPLFAAQPLALQAQAWLQAWARAGTGVPRPADRPAPPLLPPAAEAWLSARARGLGLPPHDQPGLARGPELGLVRGAEPGLAPGADPGADLGAAARGAAPDGPARNAALHITLADGLQLRVQGQLLTWARKPPRRLLALAALLALRCPAEWPRARLADALYPELDGDAALHALETALYRLRRLLPPGVLRNGAVGVAFDPARVHVDRQAQCSTWLPEFDEPWADAARAGQPVR